MHPLSFRESWEQLKCEHCYKVWFRQAVVYWVISLKKKEISLYTLRALPLFQGDSKCMFPWEILVSTSHVLCLWEATYYTVVCPKLLHIPAASGAWQRAGFPCKPVALLCSLGQCCSKETLLTYALWAVLTPAWGGGEHWICGVQP